MKKMNEPKFEKDFILGAATSAYQIEGASKADGKGESIWDRFCKWDGAVDNGDTGEIACDHYHRMEEDVALMKRMGLDSYRFSVSWARILPDGVGAVNAKGLEFYDRLVAALQKANIKPMMTLYHWDLPQKLEDRGGWLNPESIGWFAEYAEVIFRHFGDRVPFYITFNEPFVFTHFGYCAGSFPPGKRDEQGKLQAGHNVLLAHGEAVRLFREQNLKAKIGIVLDYAPNLPASDDEKDAAAAALANRFWAGWFYEAIVKGKYPSEARAWFEERGMLPFVKEGDEQRIAEPIDYLGINHYFCNYVKYNPQNLREFTASADPDVQRSDIGWVITPDGFYQFLMSIKDELKTAKLPLYITENGIALNDQVNLDGEVRDYDRIDYYRLYLDAISKAKAGGADIRGYYAWSLLDNFEWAKGYAARFGLVHVDYRTRVRTVKESGKWYAGLIAAKNGRESLL